MVSPYLVVGLILAMKMNDITIEVFAEITFPNMITLYIDNAGLW